MVTPIRLLIIEDSKDDAELLAHHLKQGGLEVVYERVEREEELIAALEQSPWDIVLADYFMPQFDGISALRIIRNRGEDIPFIFISGAMGEDVAVLAMKEGAQDYIMKGNLTRLVPAVEREINEFQIRKKRREAEETILHMAYYDALTHLPNRALFIDLLDRAITAAQQKNESVAVLSIDFKNFKGINDALGYSFGDLLLQQAALRLKNLFRNSDALARITGDEFAVLAPGATPSGISLASQRILQAFETPFTVEGVPVELEISVGAALFPEHKDTSELLLQSASVAMHTAKATGNDFVMYSSDQDRQTAYHVRLMGELRQAIEWSQLVLYYQTKIDLKTNTVFGLEAFTRWKHPQFGLLLPRAFLPSAEKSGLIKLIVSWNLEGGLHQLKRWDQGVILSPLSLSINLSARNLHDRFLIRHVEKILKETDISPDRLEFEITEEAIITNQAKAKEMLVALSALGTTISIDNFGTGYISLPLLKQLPIQGIKIDLSLIHELTREKGDSATVASIISLAHQLELWVTAEGVEDQQTKDRLVAFGCDFAQGYFFSRPQPAEEISEVLTGNPVLP